MILSLRPRSPPNYVVVAVYFFFCQHQSRLAGRRFQISPTSLISFTLLLMATLLRFSRHQGAHRELSRSLNAFIGPSCSTIPSCRYYASTRSSTSQNKSENPLSDAKAKPKSTTPLRRSASASLPIRSNPTPTRGDIQPIFTLATAERYLLSRLRSHPDLPARSQALHESWWIPKWGTEGKEGEVFVFSNGSIVCWGLCEADAKRFAEEVIDRSRGMEVARLNEAETEELEFVVDPIELSGTSYLCIQKLTLVVTNAGKPDCRVI